MASYNPKTTKNIKFRNDLKNLKITKNIEIKNNTWILALSVDHHLGPQINFQLPLDLQNLNFQPFYGFSQFSVHIYHKLGFLALESPKVKT